MEHFAACIATARPAVTTVTEPCMQKVTYKIVTRKHRNRLVRTPETCNAYKTILISITSSRAWAFAGAPTASVVVSTIGGVGPANNRL